MTTTTTMKDQPQTGTINGIPVNQLKQAMADIKKDKNKAQTRWKVTTHWRGGARSDTKIDGYEIGGQHVDRQFTLKVDEPVELCGTNQYANPQEFLLAATNSCIMGTYVAAASMMGITLTHLQIETTGDIDLRGFLGLDASVSPGYESLNIKVDIGGDGTEKQFRKLHEAVKATSPNYFNMSHAIALNMTTNVVQSKAA